MKSIAESVVDDLVQELYGQRVLSNLMRPPYVERLLARLLGESWRCVGGDWSGWDLQDSDSGLRAEVKQSAARQTWSDGPTRQGKPTKPIFDIEERTGYYTKGGSTWIAAPGRPADLYIFAWHPGFAPKEAVDHKDPEQWEFYLVAEPVLPKGQKTIGLSSLLKLPHQAVRHDTIAREVMALLPSLAPLKGSLPER